MPEKMRALQYAESMSEAAYDPGKLCTMGEVSKLFDLLFNELIGNSETPAAGTAGDQSNY